MRLEAVAATLKGSLNVLSRNGPVLWPYNFSPMVWIVIFQGHVINTIVILNETNEFFQTQFVIVH